MSGILRVASFTEGTWVTGPIKPLLMFARMTRQASDGTRPVEVSLITTRRWKSGRPPRRDALIEAAELNKIRIDVITESRPWDYRVVRRLTDLLTTLKPDIVETHQVKCHFILTQALLWGGLRREFRWIAYHHGYTRANMKVVLYEALDRWSLRYADHVVTFCRPFAHQLMRRGVDRCRLSVISNAIEPPKPPNGHEISSLRKRLGLSPADLVILTVGRLSPEKGHQFLIEAFAALQTELVPPVHLFLVGDGPQRDPLEKSALATGNHVHFLGHQPNAWPYYFIADVFALPSLSEGSPLVLFEAMAAHSAIVASAVGGIPEILTTGSSGMLVQPGNADALAEAIRSVLSDQALRERLRLGAARSSAEHSPAHYRKRMLQIYAKALGSA